MRREMEEYKYHGLSGVSYINFTRFFFDALQSNPTYAACIVDARIPGMGNIRKAGASSVLGGAFAATIGIGWREGTKGAILLKDCNVKLVAIEEYDQWARLRCLFSVPKASYGKATISGKMQGWLSNRQAVDLQFKGERVPGFHEIMGNKELCSRILYLFRSKLVLVFKKYNPEILIEFEKKDQNQFCVVESGLQRSSRAIENWESKLGVSYAGVTVGLFDVVNTIASLVLGKGEIKEKPTEDRHALSCRHCGAPMRTGALFCGKCGKKIG